MTPFNFFRANIQTIFLQTKGNWYFLQILRFFAKVYKYQVYFRTGADSYSSNCPEGSSVPFILPFTASK